MTTHLNDDENIIAICGMANIFPDAPNLQTYWQNLCNNHVAIRNVPPHRWDPNIYLDPSGRSKDKSYTQIGGFVQQFHLDARLFRLPPKAVASIDLAQQWALVVAQKALEDATLLPFADQQQQYPHLHDFNRERCAVIFGNSLGGENKERSALPVWMHALRDYLENTNKSSPQTLAAFSQCLAWLQEQVPALTEDTMPGELPNCIAGRIANLFNLSGLNFVCDAACASALLAVHQAVLGLRSHHYDTVVVGGSDHSMDPTTFVKFCRLGALGRHLSAPFDSRASGFVMGEGAGALVLKRWVDAKAEHLPVYALIVGIGGASDGRGKGIAAPNPRGQKLAIERAWQDAGRRPSDATFFEAHGTSTVVGDTIELQTLSDILAARGCQRAIPIGSVKSMIGHLKSAAGAASMIKTALALKHGQLPPSANFIEPPVDSPLHRQLLKVNTQLWPLPEQTTWLAGVSAFGFGGVNCHVVLQSVPPSPQKTMTIGRSEHASSMHRITGSDASPDKNSINHIETAIIDLVAEKTGYTRDELQLDYQLEADLGIDSIKQAEIFSSLQSHYPQGQWDSNHPPQTLREVLHCFGVASQIAAATSEPAASIAASHSADDTTNLDAYRQTPWLSFAADEPDKLLAIAQTQLAQASKTHWGYSLVTSSPKRYRLTFLADSLAQAQQKLQHVQNGEPKMLANKGIFIGDTCSDIGQGKLAFLFPGQGSQYLGMLQNLAQQFPIVAETFAQANAFLTDMQLLKVVWPAQHDEASETQLRATQHCQSAMLVADVAMLRLLKSFGLEPDMVAGHSLGEWAALVAAGILSFTDALTAVAARGNEMSSIRVDDNGTMAVVAADSERITPVLTQCDGYVVVANKNCFNQTVIAGHTKTVAEAMQRLQQLHIEARLIPVSHAFHSAVVAPAKAPMRRLLQQLSIALPKVPILSNVTADYYPNDVAQIADLLAEQLTAPVEFIAQIERMYQDGARCFVEVGPKRALCGMVRNILANKPILSLATNHPKKADTLAFFETLAQIDAYRPRHLRTAATPSSRHLKAVPSPHPASTAHHHQETVVISGCALALPGMPLFNDWGEETFARLIAGESGIQPVAAQQQAAIRQRNITRLNKQSGTFETIQSDTPVIQLAASLPSPNLVEWFGIEPALANTYNDVVLWSLAMGIETLRDAGLPLMQHYRTTSTGQQLLNKWALPPSLGASTGVIVASAFPEAATLLGSGEAFGFSQGAQHCQQLLAPKLKQLKEVLNSSDPQCLAALADIEALTQTPYDYQLPHKWLLSAMFMGHALLAQHIGALGPNTHVNAACASGSQALAMAADWIALGRCQRVLVVSIDNVTHPSTLPWIGAGFLATGAASVEKQRQQAAVPFGLHRNGLILGAAACGFMVERQSSVSERGMQPLATLLHSYYGNSAFHATRLDLQHLQQMFAQFFADLQQQLGVDAAVLSRRMFFVSHETYTPARGGSATAEIGALKHHFGTLMPHILIANTKGFTGHPMGASVEDAMAIKGLQLQKLPPLPNQSNLDPEFADLQFVRADVPWHRDVAVRFAAGFGSQLALLAYQRGATTLARLANPDTYQAWLQHHAEEVEQAGLSVQHRCLKIIAHGTAASLLGIPSLQLVAPQPSSLPAATTVAAKLGTEDEQPSTSQPNPSLTQPCAEDVIAVFAAATGYNRDELHLDNQLEADLGIDSIKQAEIMATLTEKFGLPTGDLPALGELGTLRSVIAAVEQHRRGGAGVTVTTTTATQPSPAAQLSVAPPQIAHGASLQRQYPQFTAELVDLAALQPLPGSFSLAGRQVALVASSDQGDVAAAWQNQLQHAGVAGVTVLDWCQTAQITSQYNMLLALLPNTEQDVQATQQALMQCLGLGRLWAKDERSEPSGFFLIGRQGGHFGMRPGTNAWLCGGAAGLCKTLEKEWPHVRCAMVDLHQSDWTSPQVIDAVLATMGMQAPAELSVVDGQIWMPRRSEQIDVNNQTAYLQSGDVVVASGGVRGITFKILQNLVAQQPLHVVLLARTVPTSPHESLVANVSYEQARIKARQHLEQLGEKASPAMIDRFLSKAYASLESYENIAYLQQAGSDVHFMAGDVCDETFVRQAAQTINERLGKPIALLLHGAGLEESKLLRDKKDTTMSQVLQVKVAALRWLQQYFAPKRIVTMGSVSARYGNAAQADYAAANECLAAMARSALNHGSDITFLNINWTAWADIGMATRGSVRKVLEHMGVEMIPSELGAYFGAMLANSHLQGDVVVAAQLGRFNTSEKIPLLPPLKLPEHGLFEAVTRQPDGWRLRCCIDLARFPSLTDHRIDNTVVVPGVLLIRLMQAACHATGMADDTLALSDIHFKKPLKLYHERPVVVEINIGVHSDRLSLRGNARFTTASGRTLQQEHFTATMPLRTSTQSLRQRMAEVATMPLGISRQHRLGPADVYTRYFHGPQFQVIQRIERLADNGMVGQCIPQAQHVWMPAATELPSPSLPMVALECAFQLAGVWQMLEHGELALPERLEHLICLEPLDAGPVTVQIVEDFARSTPHQRVFHLALYGHEHRLVAVVAGYSPIKWQSLPQDQQFLPEQAAAARSRSALIPTRHIAEALQTSTNTPLTERLAAAELSYFQRLKLAKRKHEWLAARCAGKALAIALAAQQQLPLSPAQCEIGKDGLGAPVWLHPQLRPLSLSLSHGHGLAMAMVALAPDSVCGVDLEPNLPRSDAWRRECFTTAEQQQADATSDPSLWLTHMWTAKEAFLKALGIGARIDLRELEVHLGDDTVAEISWAQHHVTSQVWFDRCYLPTAPKVQPADEALSNVHVIAYVLLPATLRQILQPIFLAATAKSDHKSA